MSLTVNFTGYDGTLGTETLPTGGAETCTTNVPADGFRRVYTLHGVVDTGITGGTNTNADIYQAIYIPIGLRVIDAWFVVREAEATNVTATASLGIVGDTNLFVDSATCAVVDHIHYMDNATGIALTTGTYATAAFVISLECGTAAFTNAVFDVYATVIDNRPDV